jgi:hypothetical protein
VYCCLTYFSCAGLLARSQYPEGPATGHLGTGFSWFPCAYKRMLRWFPRPQVATTCFSCSPPDLNFLDTYFIFIYMHYNHCHRATAHLQLNILLYYYYYSYYSPYTMYHASSHYRLLQCWSITTPCHCSHNSSHRTLFVLK